MCFFFYAVPATEFLKPFGFQPFKESVGPAAARQSAAAQAEVPFRIDVEFSRFPCLVPDRVQRNAPHGYGFVICSYGNK